MAKEWKNVHTTRRGQEYVDFCELSTGPRSACRALFFRNTHKTTGEKIVSLKIVRQKKEKGTYITKDDKTITLDPSELDRLIEYIQEYYAPLNIGMKEFIEANEDTAKLFLRVQELGITDEEMVRKLDEAGILSRNLSVAITAAERNNAIIEFEESIDTETLESFWQNWFSVNKWVLGSEYLNILPERDIDTHDIADYLMRSIDGYLDIVEIKRPTLSFWSGPDTHGNYYPSSQLTAAISQCLNYLHRIELQSNSVEFLERVEGTKTVKPMCMLVYGRSANWNEAMKKSLRILNAAFHNLHIMTYDQLLQRAKQLIGVGNDDEDTELPF